MSTIFKYLFKSKRGLVMKIEKGNKFLCIKDVVMIGGDIAYKRGEIYQSEYDECITDIQGDRDHYWDIDDEDAPHIYFKPLSEVDRVYTDATDRLRGLYERYQGDKFGDPSSARYFGVKLSDGEDLCLYTSVIYYSNSSKTCDYVTEDTFIELMGVNDKPVVEQDEYSWVNNGLQDNSKYDKPKHYSKGIDTFSRMEANCTKEECLAFAKGNIDKYNWRTKGQDLEDFDKIISYAKWAKSILNKNDWNI